MVYAPDFSSRGAVICVSVLQSLCRLFLNGGSRMESKSGPMRLAEGIAATHRRPMGVKITRSCHRRYNLRTSLNSYVYTLPSVCWCPQMSIHIGNKSEAQRQRRSRLYTCSMQLLDAGG